MDKNLEIFASLWSKLNADIEDLSRFLESSCADCEAVGIADDINNDIAWIEYWASRSFQKKELAFLDKRPLEEKAAAACNRYRQAVEKNMPQEVIDWMLSDVDKFLKADKCLR